MLSRSRLVGLLLMVLASSLLMVVGVALAALQPGGTFTDDNGNVHEGNIEAIAAEGITKGCNPPANSLYCPDGTVTRGQMAAFLRRAFSLPSSSADYFFDDNDSVFESDINAVAMAGITKGCNPPANDRFCPEGKITREQMAAFLRRAFRYPTSSTDFFTDDDASIFQTDINAIAEAGVTLGCNPPTNDRYCPTALVKRDQMASFFARALGLSPIVPPPTTPQSVYVDVSYDATLDTWKGSAGTERVELSWSNDLYGWIGHLGTDSVSLLRSGDGVWTGNIGSASVVVYDNWHLGVTPSENWTGFVESRSISLSGGYYAGTIDGFIGSVPVSLTCDEDDFPVRRVRGTGPRSVGAFAPMLCESYNWD